MNYGKLSRKINSPKNKIAARFINQTIKCKAHKGTNQKVFALKAMKNLNTNILSKHKQISKHHQSPRPRKNNAPSNSSTNTFALACQHAPQTAMRLLAIRWPDRPARKASGHALRPSRRSFSWCPPPHRPGLAFAASAYSNWRPGRDHRLPTWKATGMKAQQTN